MRSAAEEAFDGHPSSLGDSIFLRKSGDSLSLTIREDGLEIVLYRTAVELAVAGLFVDAMLPLT